MGHPVCMQLCIDKCIPQGEMAACVTGFLYFVRFSFRCCCFAFMFVGFLLPEHVGSRMPSSSEDSVQFRRVMMLGAHHG